MKKATLFLLGLGLALQVGAASLKAPEGDTTPLLLRHGRRAMDGDDADDAAEVNDVSDIAATDVEDMDDVNDEDDMNSDMTPSTTIGADDDDADDPNDLYDDDDYFLEAYNSSLPQCTPSRNGGFICDREAFPTCNITDVGFEGCSLFNITRNRQEVINIATGEGTSCINTTQEYYFQVLPANQSKLMFWFNGGGACWSNNISSLGACTGYPGGPDFTQLVGPNPVTTTGGFLNRSNPDAPFHDYSMVVLPYCSGDMFVGDVIRTYINETTGETIAVIPQSGANNTMAVLRWALANYPNVSELVIGGCSAGSLGAQAWSNYFYTSFNQSHDGKPPKTAILADGYAGVFPSYQTTLINEYNPMGTAWVQNLPEDYKERLANSTLYWCEITNYFQAATPEVTFLATQAEFDETQLAYYNVLALTTNNTITAGPDTPACANASVPFFASSIAPSSLALGGAGFFNATLGLYDGYSHINTPTNFFSYLANTTQHCFMSYDNIYNMSIVDMATGKVVRLVEWLDDAEDRLDADDIEDDTDDVNDMDTNGLEEDELLSACDGIFPCPPFNFGTTEMTATAGTDGGMMATTTDMAMAMTTTDDVSATAGTAAA